MLKKHQNWSGLFYRGHEACRIHSYRSNCDEKGGTACCEVNEARRVSFSGHFAIFEQAFRLFFALARVINFRLNVPDVEYVRSANVFRDGKRKGKKDER